MRVAASLWRMNEPLPHMMQMSSHTHTRHARMQPCLKHTRTCMHTFSHMRARACVHAHVCVQTCTHRCKHVPIQCPPTNMHHRRQAAVALFILSRWPWTAALLQLLWSAVLIPPPHSACHSRGCAWVGGRTPPHLFPQWLPHAPALAAGVTRAPVGRWGILWAGHLLPCGAPTRMPPPCPPHAP